MHIFFSRLEYLTVFHFFFFKNNGKAKCLLYQEVRGWRVIYLVYVIYREWKCWIEILSWAVIRGYTTSLNTQISRMPVHWHRQSYGIQCGKLVAVPTAPRLINTKSDTPNYIVYIYSNTRVKCLFELLCPVKPKLWFLT